MSVHINTNLHPLTSSPSIADIVTDAELLAIVEHFTHWNTDSLALALGLTRSEMATLPSNPKDRLTLILNEWKRRYTCT